MTDKRVFLVDGYQAKPQPEVVARGHQPSSSTQTQPPRAEQLPQGAQSTVKPAKEQ